MWVQHQLREQNQIWSMVPEKFCTRGICNLECSKYTWFWNALEQEKEVVFLYGGFVFCRVSFLPSAYLTLSWVGELKLPFSLPKFLQEGFFVYISLFSYISTLLCLQLNSTILLLGHWSLKTKSTLSVIQHSVLIWVYFSSTTVSIYWIVNKVPN